MSNGYMGNGHAMLKLFGKSFFHNERIRRRELLKAGMISLGGLTLSDLLRANSLAGDTRRAKHCIFVFLNGGQSQLDTFDMKPLAPDGIRGPYQPIATQTPGIEISEKLPKLARITDRLAIVRSAHHHLTAHNTGAAYALSGHSPGTDKDIFPKVTNHPSMGSVVKKIRPEPAHMPSAVLTPRLLFDMGFPTPSAGGGWLGHAYDPFPVARNRMMARAPKWDGNLPAPTGLQFPDDMTLRRLELRKSLYQNMDRTFADHHEVAATATMDVHQQKAFDLILSSKAQAAFDLTTEPAEMHDRYGRHEMGQVLLLSRRLIEAGVHFVTANAVSNPKNTKLSPFQIWDTHFDHFRLYNDNLMPEFDQSLSALITDLEERGLLDETLLLIAGEFGRTPTINTSQDGGRDHWPHVYSVLFAGGGIRGGQTFGASDKHAASVKDRPVRPDDLSATVFHALGIPHDSTLEDLTGRPHRITDGEPITPLFS